jgi:preprotein translocase subunit SecG
MLNFVNLLAANGEIEFYEAYAGVAFALIVIMAIAALAAIVLVLLQPSNSSGIDALGGSSETFFGKNKGKALEEKMKKWTWICLIVLAVLSIVFFLLPVIFG